jgi:hypothetical protein
MFAANTPFKIATDENDLSFMKDGKKGTGGLKNRAPLSSSTTFTKPNLGTTPAAPKSARKALGELTSSQVNVRIQNTQGAPNSNSATQGKIPVAVNEKSIIKSTSKSSTKRSISTVSNIQR